MPRKRESKNREQLAFDIDSILKALEDSFIVRLGNYFKRLTNSIAKKINDLPLFVNAISSENKKDIDHLKKLLQGYYKKVGKETIKQTNKEIQELSGKRTLIKIPDINEGLRYRAEQLAKQKIKDYNKEIREKILAGEGSLKDKKEVLSNLKKTQNVFINRHVTIVSRMESVTVANNQRLEAFKKSSIVTGVQFLAVMDNRTTPICQSRHRMVLKLDDPLLPNFKPPCHFGCRSLLSPVTIFDKDIKFTDIKSLQEVPNKNFGKKEFKKIETDHPNKDYSKLTKKGYKANNPYNKKLNDKDFDIILNKEIKDILDVTENKFERCIILNKFGNVIFEGNGGVNYVSFPKSILKNKNNNVETLLHNHPNSSSFSFKDFTVAIKNEVKNTLAIVTNGFNGKGYFFVNSFKNSKINLIDAENYFDSFYKTSLENEILKANGGNIDYRYISLISQNYAWQETSKKYNFNYGFKSL
jgi:SPP1 gp7 family putative phage head morphogenesis protein